MRISLTSILLSVPLLTCAVPPTSNTVLDGAFVLNGGGSTIDATTLGSLTGYFMNSGSLDMNDVTLKNFHTFGSPGSGGGAGLGGTLFINSGVTVNLNNVNFIASSVSGGLGGTGDTGGSLNNVLTPTSNGIPGADGEPALFGMAFLNNGNGRQGYNGKLGGAAIDGFGGKGGDGGLGGPGEPTSLQQVQAIADVVQLTQKTIKDAATTAALSGENAAIEIANIAFQALNAAQEATCIAQLICDLLTPWPETVFAAYEGSFAVNEAIIAFNTSMIAFVGSNITPYDVFKLAAQSTFVTATQVTAYEVTGTSGKGGLGGLGAPGGNGSFGYGGGAGGDGGMGGDATPVSIAAGGQGGIGGIGGDGGFGGGGGRGGDLGDTGVNGNYRAVSNGKIRGRYALGGLAGFGGGAGSRGNGQLGGGPNGSLGQGGSGYGGAIFVKDGAILNFNGPATFCSNSAQEGGSANGGITGTSAGADLFMMTGSTVTLNPGAANTITFGGSIADDSAGTLDVFSVARGQGAGLTLTSGRAVLSGLNTYTGVTTVSGGSIFEAIDGIGLNPYSHLFLNGGIFQGSGTFARSLGTSSTEVEFSAATGNGFSAVDGDLLVTLDCGSPLTWGQTYFLGIGQPFLFGSTTATDNVTFTNAIDLAGVNETILATASSIAGVSNRAIFTGVLSNGSLTVGDLTHTGIVELTAANTYLSPTQVSGGTLVLSGSLQSATVTIDLGATMEDVNGGLVNGTALTVNGTFILDGDDTINTLAGSGIISLNGGTLTISSGAFSGPITSTNSTDGITKVSAGNLTLSGASTYTGPTLVNGGTLTLTGSLLSQTINIAPGATLDDVSGGLDSNATVTVDGTLLIGATETIGSLFGSGSVSINLASLTVGSGNFSGVISGANPAFSFTKDTVGILTLSGANTYVGPTFVNAGTLILTGSLASNAVTIAVGATMDDVNGGLAPLTTLTVDGTFNLGADEAIGILNGATTGLINLNGGTLTVDSGTYDGVIAGTNPLYGLTKVSGGTLTLSGDSTYNGPTLINAGTLTLTGSLLSPTINVALGAVLNDVNGGLDAAATLTNAGTVNLPVDDTIFALINSGTINGAGTLTALTYALNNGSIINANLGTGTLTSNGTVQLNGTSSANPIIIASGTMTLGSGGRLLLLPDVTANGTLVLGGNEAINGLFGTGGVALGGNQLTVNEGSFSGVISGTAASQLIKTTTGILTLSGANTYTGITQINAGELVLTGSLASLTVNVALGAILDDNNSGLAPGSTLTNDGLVNLPLNDTILALINSGTINGAGTLTAATYALNNGSLINANLGTGILTTYPGTETLNGTSAAGIVNVSAGSTFNLGGNQRLSAGATVTVDGTLSLPGFDQIINVLNGNGGTISAHNFQVNNGGTFNGFITATSSFTAQGGILNLNNTILTTSTLDIGPAATLNFNGAAGVATTNFILLDNASTFTISGGALVNNSTGVTIPPNAAVNVVTGGQFFTGGNFFLDSNATLTLDATGLLNANVITTGLNSLITAPDSSRLNYTLLTGFGTVDSLGNIFVNDVGETVAGYMIFLDSFTNLGVLTPGFSPGLITIGGDYVEGGHYIIDLQTLVPVTGFDQVRVGGTASLLPTSIFNVHINSAVLVQGNFFQVIANSVGGPIPVGGFLGALTLTVDAVASNPNLVLFDAGTGRIYVTNINPPFPPIPVNPKKNPFFHLGCTRNQNHASKAIFTEALITPTQINTNTVAGKLALQILQGNNCDVLQFYTPTYYGAMSDYAFMGDRALAAQVWDRVSTFTSLPEQCCPKFSSFFGFIESEQNKIHKSDLQRQDIYVGADYSTCRGFSMGVAVSESKGKIHSFMGKSRIEGNTGIIYLRKNLGAYFTAFGTVSGSIQDNHLRRPTQNGHVKARSQSKSITGNLGLQFKGWQLNCFSFAPRVNVVYSHAHVSSFSEKGAIDALHNSGYDARFVTGELGMSALCSTKLWSRAFDIEATIGIEQPFKYQKGYMDVYVLSSSDIAYTLFVANTAKTRLSGGLNFGYNLFKAVTLYGGYEVTTGGDWNHVANAGIRVCL